MRTLLSVLLFSAGLVAIASLKYEAIEAQDQPDRPYHPIGISDIAKEDPAHWRGLHTHIAVSGFLTYKKVEDDGDLHLRLCDGPSVKTMARKHCIVAEAIPALPEVAHQAHDLTIGQPVTVKGIYRYDAERGHRWGEVHPIEAIESGHVLPPLEKKP